MGVGDATRRRVLLAGATGLVGGECLRLLLDDPAFSSVTVLVRRPLGFTHPKLIELVVDFDRLETTADRFGTDSILCALGTTIKQAGSRESFRRVDYEYPVSIARLGRSRGASHFLLVSALGANSQSRVFYNRVKGELEATIRQIGFPTLTIVRPSLLLGPRKKPRLGEEIGKLFGFLLPSRMKPVEARQVAATLVHAAKAARPGTRVIENADILAGILPPQSTLNAG